LCARCMIFRNSWDVHISCGDEVEREREREGDEVALRLAPQEKWRGGGGDGEQGERGGEGKEGVAGEGCEGVRISGRGPHAWVWEGGRLLGRSWGGGTGSSQKWLGGVCKTKPTSNVLLFS
jgi:hypothetical protein